MENYKIADLHCDTLLEILEKKQRGQASSFAASDLCVDAQKLKAGGYFLQTTALFTDRKGKRMPEHEVLRLYLEYLRALEADPNLIAIKNREDLETCWQENRPGLLLSLEEGDVMFQDLELLELWYRLGVRMIALCWNHVNAIGHPNFTVDASWDYKQGSPLLIVDEENGLTEFGRTYVKKMEELGILVDVSHLSDRGFWDVIEIASAPVIASHSNARFLCAVSRNLDDAMIQAIAQTGGLIGINFCADFLRPESGNNSRLEDIVRHILYLRDLVGVDHIALGTDYDGIHSRLEIADSSQMPRLLSALKKAGLCQEEVAKIAGGNVYRVLHSILPAGPGSQKNGW